MSFIKSFFTKGIILIGLFMILASGVFANTEDSLSDGSHYLLNTAGAAMFKGGNIKKIDSYSELSTDNQKIDMTYIDGKLHLRFGIINGFCDNTIDLSTVLYPSKLKMFKGKTLIGKVETITSPYKLLNLRIENDSKSHTLLKPNLYMEGHKVLTVGILNQKTKDIYYLQHMVNDIDFDQMLADAEKNCIEKDISDQDLSNLELKYFRLESPDPNIVTFSTSKYTVTANANKKQTQKNQPLSASAASLIYRVPDSIFKSGTFNQWYSSSDIYAAAPYSYTWVTFRFAGTENRLTYLIFCDIVGGVNWDSEKFTNQLTIRDNVSVLYNANTGELGLFGDDNRISLSELTLDFKSNTVNGVFISRYHTGLKAGSKMGNIVRAILAWVPYASTIVSSYDYLTASSQTQADRWFTYPVSAEAQRDAYGGKIINQISAEGSGFYKKGDYMLLITEGNAIYDISWGLSYTVTYN